MTGFHKGSFVCLFLNHEMQSRGAANLIAIMVQEWQDAVLNLFLKAVFPIKFLPLPQFCCWPKLEEIENQAHS